MNTSASEFELNALREFAGLDLVSSQPWDGQGCAPEHAASALREEGGTEAAFHGRIYQQPASPMSILVFSDLTADDSPRKSPQKSAAWHDNTVQIDGRQEAEVQSALMGPAAFSNSLVTPEAIEGDYSTQHFAGEPRRISTPLPRHHIPSISQPPIAPQPDEAAVAVMDGQAGVKFPRAGRVCDRAPGYAGCNESKHAKVPAQQQGATLLRNTRRPHQQHKRCVVGISQDLKRLPHETIHPVGSWMTCGIVQYECLTN